MPGGHRRGACMVEKTTIHSEVKIVKIHSDSFKEVHSEAWHYYCCCVLVFALRVDSGAMLKSQLCSFGTFSFRNTAVLTSCILH